MIAGATFHPKDFLERSVVGNIGGQSVHRFGRQPDKLPASKRSDRRGDSGDDTRTVRRFREGTI
jgi:hypothetical protein